MERQLSLSDFAQNVFKIDKPVRLIELFAGIGSQAMALRDLGVDFERYRVVENDRFAIASYNAIHGTDFPVIDICDMGGGDLGITDTDEYCYILTYSFPCLTGDSLVLTSKGYKRIDEIESGDYVLTAENTYAKVITAKKTGHKPVYKINGMAFDEVKATANHKFLARKKRRIGHFGTRIFDEPEWIALSQLDTSYYLGIAINQNSIIPEWHNTNDSYGEAFEVNKLDGLMDNPDFWWIIGRYMGDGWLSKQDGIVICCGRSKLGEIDEKANGLFKYSISERRTTFNYHFCSKELFAFCEQFGKGALKKHLTNTIFDLPESLLKAFIEGYISSDGCILPDGLISITTTSRELAYGIGQCVAKAYHVPYRIYKACREPKHIIEGRTVNQHDTYQVKYKLDKRKQDHAFYENGHIWFPIKSIQELGMEDVYDLEVENAHSFTVQNTIVHNCQDLSLAGKQAGMSKESGTRSSLLWEVERLLNEVENLPQVLLMENVPQVMGTKNIDNFNYWKSFLGNKGYSSYAQILNAKDYGVAQNRKRAFMVSLLGNYSFTFPEPIPLTKCLNDYLEDDVPEKYFVNTPEAQKLIDNLIESGKIESPFPTQSAGGGEAP